MIPGDRSSWPTLQDSADAGLFIFGICSVCHEKHEADMPALIAKHGPTTKTRDVMDRTAVQFVRRQSAGVTGADAEPLAATPVCDSLAV